jgi:hypothetical protein
MNKNDLFNYIEERIYGNNNGAITGPILQDVLKKIVEFNSEQEGRIGKDGVGIDSITRTRGSDAQGTYTQLTIKTTDNRTTPFKVYDGSDGADGAQGPRGAAGRDGINGTDGSDGRDGRDGEDGRDGKDGKDGKDGFQGRKGAAIRGPYDFYSMSSTTRWWCNGEESEDYPDSTLWIDIILKDEVYYYCNTTYYGRLAPWNNVRQNWTAGESYEFIATKILLARNAKINFLTNNELYLMDSNGHITGGAAGGNGVNFWAGAEHPSNGKFRVYADGRLVATDAQIKGAITATSLVLRGSDIENYIHNEVDDAFNGFNPDDAIDENQVNDLIRQYLMTVDYVKPSDLNGYFNEERLRDWFRRNYSGWTEEQIEEIVRRIAQAETSSVEEIDLGDGRIKHIAYIGGRSYEWITVDTGDYIILGAVVSGRTGSGLTRFIVDKNGLLQANNAIIYGKVYASEGYFMGSVSATDGYFRGDVTANSLTLGPGCELDIDPSALDIDLSDYYAAGMPWSSNTGLFKVGKDGLLQAKNAIISGNVYATNGVFKGDVYANNGSFKGTISAESGYIKDLHFGSATGKRLSVYIDDTIDEKIADALTGDLDPEVINQAISDYIANSGFTGYVTEDFFNNWINEWNAAHSASPISESAVSAIVKSIVGSEISITSAVTNEWGGITHIANIGGREYRWDTYNTGDYLVLGNWFGDSATTGDGGFIVSTDGLLQANNAVIYGKVYASEGYFKGSVSADSGYFKGNVTANSLTLGGTYGNKSLKQYVEGEVASAVEGEIDADMINSMISTYLDESGFTNFVTTDDYHAFSGFVAGWMAAHSASGITWASISGFAKNLINSELSNAFDETTNSDGSVTHTMTIGGREYSWDTYDADDYLLLGNWVSGTTPGSGFSSFLISKKGLLQANNAVIYGKVYASEGYFKGSVSADSGYFKGSVSAENGYFKGSVEATSGKIGSVLITPQGLSATNIHITNNYMWSDNVALKGSISAENGYFTGELKAATGSFKGAISATSLYLGGQTYTEMPEGGSDPDALKKDVVVTGAGGTSFSVSSDGLLQANNAVINGTVYANDGYFKGSISATNGHFSGIIDASDIIIGDKSLKFQSTGNTFEIKNEPIDVDYIPKTYATESYSNYSNYYNGRFSAQSVSQLAITGSSYSVDIPKCDASVTADGQGQQSSSQNPQFGVTAITFVTSASNWAYSTTGIPVPSQCVAFQTAYTTVTGTEYGVMGSVTAPAINNLSLKGASDPGRTYAWGYRFIVDGNGYWTNPWCRIDFPSEVVTIVADTSDIDTQFIRIGSNGMQIFLGDGFYFTAARTTGSTGGPVISFAGNVGGVMKYFKVDKNGMIIDGATIR